MTKQQNKTNIWLNMPGWVYFVGLVFVLYLFFKFSEIYNPIKNKKSEMSVNSYELISDYRQNVAAAKSKYNGKVISVNGEVTNIYETWIVIGYDITCEFSDNKGLKSIESIQKGSIVTVKGEVDGTTFGGSVQIRNCIIENSNSN